MPELQAYMLDSFVDVKAEQTPEPLRLLQKGCGTSSSLTSCGIFTHDHHVDLPSQDKRSLRVQEVQ